MVVFLLFLSLFLSACTSQLGDKQIYPLEEPIRIGGIISRDIKLKGTVIVEKDLLITNDAKVEIEEGTEILVEKTDISRTEPTFLMPEIELMVEGRLIIKGKSEKPVKISSLSKEGIDWGGIIINGGTLEGENIEISNSYNAINLLKGSFSLKNVTFKKNKIALSNLDNYGFAVIKDSLFSGNETAIINKSFSSELYNLTIIENEEGLLLKECPRKVENILVRNNLYGVIMNIDCIDFNLINIKSYENKNNIIFADIYY